MRKTEESRSLVAAVDDPFERFPEHILHYILALLRSNKEAAKTAVVSKTWHRAWSSLPIFDFHAMEFLPEGPEGDTVQYEPHEMQKRSDRFLGFVDKAISRLHEHQTAIPRLRVSTTLIKINHSSNLLDKWIGMALDSGTQELRLDFKDLYWKDSYLVPARVFTSGFIKTLSLLGPALITPLGSITSVNMSSVQSLEFSETPLDELMLQKLLQGCPLLEELDINSSKLSQVVISGPNNLRRISLSGRLNRVEIEASSLEEFLWYNFGYDTLQTQVVLLLDRCPGVKHLKLRNCSITQDEFHKLLSKFPLLESLTIRSCVWLKKIMILNPLLKKIEVEECEGLVDIEIGSANLSCFRYGTMTMRLPFIRMQNPTALSVCEANFSNKWNSYLGPNWFIQLREFLTRSCQFRSLAFELFVRGNENVHRNAVPLLPYDVDRLRLHVRTPRLIHGTILNMMLSLSHPTTLRVTPSVHGCEFLKFVCDKLENRGDNDDDDDDDVCCCCSGSGHRKCWLHELKGVEVERITSWDDRYKSVHLDWRTLHELLPNIGSYEDVCFKLQWD